MPNSVTTIGDYVFYGCTELTSPIYNSTIFAFMPTSYNSSYTIPGGIEKIAGEAFFGCSGLTTITIPNSVTSVGEYAFGDCSGLASISCEATIPPICKNNTFNNVEESIPLYVPVGCVTAYQAADEWKKFVSITDKHLIGDFYYYLYPSSQTAEVTSLLSEKKADSISIPSFVIYENTTFDVTHIGTRAFYGYSSLINVSIPNSVISIEDYAFYGCSSLASLTIPNSVTNIGDYAFASCFWLTNVTCYAIIPPTCGTGVFFGVDKTIPLCVPAESITLYSAADEWKDFFEIIGVENAIESVSASTTQLRKSLENGHLYILLPDGTRYSATGQRVE